MLRSFFTRWGKVGLKPATFVEIGVVLFVFLLATSSDVFSWLAGLIRAAL